MMTSAEIRRRFLDFFAQKGHREVHSSSLVPHNDPTLLFTNAGMNQFKDVFLGLEKRDYTRATSSQKCVRAGGKHNDLENVGFTNRHHTFFEMLGNFSFGDYFKKDAIAYAWEVLTSPEWFGISKDKLFVTIFKGEGGVPRDAEAYELWVAQGVSKDRVYEFGLKDNFWQMGDTGPCGPCSEIHYDMGPAASDQGHTDCAFGCDCGRYVEIWNLVFMQFDRDASGKLNPLPKPSIDTGMGLERIAAVLQGVISNYETDLFVPLIKRAAELTLGHGGPGVSPVHAKATLDKTGGDARRSTANEVAGHKSAASLRVIADHSRAATFLISDGVLPSNEGRGYVLRKIIRRAITHGRLLGQTKPFLHEMVFAVRDLMQDAYPELKETAPRGSKVLRAEEGRFAHTLGLGLQKLEEDLQETQKMWRRFEEYVEDPQKAEAAGIKDDEISEMKVELECGQAYNGARAFKLYDTFGLPLDFMVDACRDVGLKFDHIGFDHAMDQQRRRARDSWKGAAKETANPYYLALAAANNPKTESRFAVPAGFPAAENSTFVGYRQTRAEDCKIVALFRQGQALQELKPGEEGEVILDHTPFYAESGGQVGDRGYLYSDALNAVVADVKGCYYPVQGVRAHQVVVRDPGKSESPSSPKTGEGWGTRVSRKGVPHPSPSGEGGDFDFTLRVGGKVDAVVDTSIREATMRNHTATHLLHAGLREVLGKHVKQAGSLVAPNHLRFDFSHFTAVEDEELQDIEDLINKEVLRNQKVEVIENVPIDVAVNEYKAMALFGEKHGDRVRVIRIGDFSTELCGGTHTGATGEIGLIKILKEGSVSSGVRRVEAVTGEGSLKHFRRDHELENFVSTIVSPLFSKPTLVAKGATKGEATAELESKSPPSAKSAEGWGNPAKDGAPASVDSTGDSTGEDARASMSLANFSPAEALKAELEKKDAEIKRLTRELDQARMKQASSSTANIGDKIRDVRGVKVLAHRVDNLERPQMRTLVDQLRDKIGSGVVVLGSATNGNVALIVGVTKDLTSRIQAGKVIGAVAQRVGGKGGGRPDLAEAGGKDPAALDAALGEAYGVVEGLLK